jgi:hypothetical protein
MNVIGPGLRPGPLLVVSIAECLLYEPDPICPTYAPPCGFPDCDMLGGCPTLGGGCETNVCDYPNFCTSVHNLPPK